jgi:hypothetical protein
MLHYEAKDKKDQHETPDLRKTTTPAASTWRPIAWRLIEEARMKWD